MPGCPTGLLSSVWRLKFQFIAFTYLCFIAVYSSTNILTKPPLLKDHEFCSYLMILQAPCLPSFSASICSDLLREWEENSCLNWNEKRNWQRMEGLEAQAQIPSELKGDLVNWCPGGSVCLEGKIHREAQLAGISNPCPVPLLSLQKTTPDLVCSRALKTWDMSIVGIQGKKRWLSRRRKFRWITWQMTKKAQESYSVSLSWWSPKAYA